MVHGDRGVQYASKDFRTCLKKHGFVQSMSRKGDCWDNAVAESFFQTLKTQLVGHIRFKTYNETERILFKYIEIYYNQKRKHSANGWRTPAPSKQRWLYGHGKVSRIAPGILAQGFQSPCQSCLVASYIRLVVQPRRFPLPTRGRAVFVYGAVHMLSDNAGKGVASGREAFSVFHGDAESIDPNRHFRRHTADSKFVCFSPVKCGTVKCATGAAIQTRIMIYGTPLL
jgi:hypothetical protein